MSRNYYSFMDAAYSNSKIAVLFTEPKFTWTKSEEDHAAYVFSRLRYEDHQYGLACNFEAKDTMAVARFSRLKKYCKTREAEQEEKEFDVMIANNSIELHRTSGERTLYISNGPLMGIPKEYLFYTFESTYKTFLKCGNLDSSVMFQPEKIDKIFLYIKPEFGSSVAAFIEEVLNSDDDNRTKNIVLGQLFGVLDGAGNIPLAQHVPTKPEHKNQFT